MHLRSRYRDTGTEIKTQRGTETQGYRDIESQRKREREREKGRKRNQETERQRAWEKEDERERRTHVHIKTYKHARKKACARSRTPINLAHASISRCPLELSEVKRTPFPPPLVLAEVSAATFLHRRKDLTRPQEDDREAHEQHKLKQGWGIRQRRRARQMESVRAGQPAKGIVRRFLRSRRTSNAFSKEDQDQGKAGQSMSQGVGRGGGVCVQRQNSVIVGALVTWAIYTQGQLLLWSSLIITGVVPGYK